MKGVIHRKDRLDNLGKASLRLILLVAIVIQGCVPSSSVPAKQVTTPVELSTSSPQVTLSPSVAPTSEETTVSIESQDTSTAINREGKTPPSNILKQDCFQQLPDLPEKNDLDGTLVLNRFADNQSSYLLNLKEKTKREWDKSLYSSVSTSPNGQWLAYSRNVETGNGPFEVIIESAEDMERGTEKKEIILSDPDWISIYGWLSNDILLLLKKSDPLVSTVAINPFTGEREEFKSNYPDQPDFGLANPSFQFYWINVSPAPDLQTVAYQQRKNKGQFLVLMDLQEKQSRAEMAFQTPLIHDPLWSLNGENFAIPITTRLFAGNPDDLFPSVQDWFQFHQDGQVVQVTHFGDFFPNPNIGRASRSPDNRFIAFWLTVNFEPIKERLAILDLETQTVIDTCIPGSYRGDARQPIWSPNGENIAIMNEYEPNSGHVLIANFPGRWVVNVAEDGIPEGWLAGDKAD